MRRAAVSVPINIVEGSLRGSKRDFVRFLTIARASLGEVEYLLELSKELGILETNDYEKIEELRRSTGALLYKLIISFTD